MPRFMTDEETEVQFRKWGLPAKYYAGWRTRTRPGAHSDARGVMVHHTGSMAQSDDYLGFLFVRGRAEDGIPGPLCNVATDTDGDLHVGSVGRANHAGKGSGSTLTKVTAGNAPMIGEIKPGPDTIDGNAHYYGNEVRYDGARAMTAAQLRTAMLHAAAICDFHDWDAGHVIGHREHTNRKNDPGKQAMDAFRRGVQALLNAGPPGKKPPLEDDDVALTDQERQALGKAGWLADQFSVTGQFTKDLNQASWLAEQFAANGQFTGILRGLADQSEKLAAQVRNMAAETSELKAQLAALNEKLEPKS